MAIIIDNLTCMPVFLECMFGDRKVSIATGFVWEHQSSNFLVTNWHVITGLHPENHQPLDESGVTPDLLRLWLHTSKKLGEWGIYDLQLFDNQGRPRWKEHDTFRSAVDVAIMPLEVPDTFQLFPVNHVLFDSFRVEISNDVFIIGFPRGITSGGKFPIWKRGSVASEPNINLDKLPKFLIDSATREGMSGSPVIAEFVGYHKDDPTNPEMSDSDWFGKGRKFVGIYSGRLPGQDLFEAQLGIVWKDSLISEIITSGVRPD